MKKTIFLLFTLFYALSGFSQDITGAWYGTLSVRGQELPLVFHIEKTKTSYRSKMDSPSQAAFGLPMSVTKFENDSLWLDSAYGISYAGVFTESNKFEGEFKQNGFSIPLKLTREKQIVAPNRPQKPKKPYPYISEKVSFKNTEAGITLAGTLTLPNGKGKFPAVILISGSGPQNRNGAVFGHQPFLVLSDYLTRNGIAVLRYDDRGIGESEGNLATSTSADFATDAQAALNYLLTRKEIDKTQIGLIGHSEGGMIAPMVATKSNDIAFLVLLAAPGIPGDELLARQNRMLGKASGMTDAQLDSAEAINRKVYQMVINANNIATLKIKLSTYLQKNVPGMSRKQIQATVNQISSPWMQYFLKYNPKPVLQKVKVPVLAINGENDLQVSPEINLKAIETALKEGGNTHVTTKSLPGLNHLFQESETGLPSEYAKIEQTFSPKAMETILNWIQKQIK